MSSAKEVLSIYSMTSIMAIQYQSLFSSGIKNVFFSFLGLQAVEYILSSSITSGGKKKSPTYTSDACCTLYVAFVPNKSFKSIQDVISNCVAQTLRDLEPLELTALKTSFTICRVLNVLSSYLSYLEVISSIYFK